MLQVIFRFRSLFFFQEVPNVPCQGPVQLHGGARPGKEGGSLSIESKRRKKQVSRLAHFHCMILVPQLVMKRPIFLLLKAPNLCNKNAPTWSHWLRKQEFGLSQSQCVRILALCGIFFFFATQSDTFSFVYRTTDTDMT